MHSIFKVDPSSQKKEFLGTVDSNDVEVQILLADEYFPNDRIIAIELPEKSVINDVPTDSKESTVFVKTKNGGYSLAD